MAKGIGNGLPLAAVVTTPEVAAVLARRLHFNTYGAGGGGGAGGGEEGGRVEVFGRWEGRL